MSSLPVQPSSARCWSHHQVDLDRDWSAHADDPVLQGLPTLACWPQIGDRKEQARAHHGLAMACVAVGEHGQARHHWEDALTRYTDLGFPEVDEVHGRLPACPHRSTGPRSPATRQAYIVAPPCRVPRAVTPANRPW